MTAVGSAAAAAVITLSAAPAAQSATAQPAAVQSVAVQSAAASAVAPAISRPTATLDAAAISQRRAAQRTAGRMLAHFGWTMRHQWKPLKWLWNRESGWNKYASNPYSGAYGIPQALPGSKMASAGNHWRTNATTQIRWGLRYIKSRYGRPRAAWNHSQAYGWY
jgi:type IV secretory pathway TrbL component